MDRDQEIAPAKLQYAELHCLRAISAFGAAPRIHRNWRHAAELGYAALAITDECSLADVVGAHAEAKNTCCCSSSTRTSKTNAVKKLFNIFTESTAAIARRSPPPSSLSIAQRDPRRGKALRLNPDRIDHLTKSMQWWDGQGLRLEQLEGLNLDRERPSVVRSEVQEEIPHSLYSPPPFEKGADSRLPLVGNLTQHLIALVNTLIGVQRHLAQHTGGFVISAGALAHLAPIENTAMRSRTVIQWDKDDLENLGPLKVDVLALDPQP
jgi:DNA polymerase III alpha subunit